MAKYKYDRGFLREWGLAAVLVTVLLVVLGWALVWGISRFYENKHACERRGMVYLAREQVCVPGEPL